MTWHAGIWVSSQDVFPVEATLVLAVMQIDG